MRLQPPLAAPETPTPAAGPHARLRSLLLAGAGWLALGGSLAVYGLVMVALHQPFHEGGRALRFFDLRIYRQAAWRVTHGRSLYATPILHGLGFTYPPFAALLLSPLAWIGLRHDEWAVTLANVGLLLLILRRSLQIPLGGRSGARGPRLSGSQAWSIAALLAAGALWLEPVSVALGYGQIDLLITALVVCDIARGDDARGKGIAIGLAAAIKLTPLIFIVYLALSRRGRAAGVASATFAATIALSLLITPHDATAFWSGRFLTTSHVGGVADFANQSLRGLLARLGDGPEAALRLDAAVAICGLGLAARAAGHGDEAAGFSLTALTALLVSPISWTHHWVLAVPAVVLLLRRGVRRRSPTLGLLAAALLALGWTYLPERVAALPSRGEVLGAVITSPYVVLAGLAIAATAAVTVWSSRRAASRGARDVDPAPLERVQRTGRSEGLTASQVPPNAPVLT